MRDSRDMDVIKKDLGRHLEMAAIFSSRGSQTSTIAFPVLQQVLEEMKPTAILNHEITHGTQKLSVKETDYYANTLRLFFAASDGVG
jgi:hypothetical protein